MCSKAIAIIKGPYVYGVIKFHQCIENRGTNVYFDLYGMKPNKKMACHIHEFGDESDGCISLGPHWNPTNRDHGSIKIDIHNSHAGDLINNILSDGSGKFKFSYMDPRVQIKGDVTKSIIGRSIVIHNGIDDLGLGGNAESKKTGNAGGRMACDIIGHSK